MDRKSLFFLGLSIAILAIMLYFIGIDQVISAVNMANKELILFAILLEISTIFLYTLRWKLINNMVNINTSLKKLLPIILVGLAINNITPSGRGGGEPVRAYILSKEENIPFKDSFATVVADRALDTFPFIVLAIIAIVGVTLFMDLDPLILSLMIAAVLAIIILLIIIIYMSINESFGVKVNNFIINLLRKFYKKNSVEIENKVTSSVFGFQKTMSNLISNKKIMIYAMPLSFIIWIFEISRVYIVFLSFGAVLSPLVIAEVFIIASLIGMIPLLPGGLGAVDGVMILFYSVAGITPSLSAAATVIERLISFWLPTILGMVILPYYGSSVLDKINITSSDEESIEEFKN